MKLYPYYIQCLFALALAACAGSEEMNDSQYTISGTGEKSPLDISVNIQDSYNNPSSRALDGTFENEDKLWANIEQVKRSGSEGSYNYTSFMPQLVSFTATKKDSHLTSEELGTTLYWDDFSSTDNDIRDNDRFLRVSYGFCLNGVDVTPNEGKISAWSVNTNQSDIVNLRKSDLLWAGNQKEVQYDGTKVRPDVSYDDRIKLPVTYTHAMSKVTIELVLDEGFDVDGTTNIAKAFNDGTNPINTTPLIYANHSVGEVDAVAQKINTTAAGAEDKITMYLKTEATADEPKTRTYEAIIAPTVMQAGNKLAEITVDGNRYDINLTDALLTAKYPASSENATWSSKLKGYETSSNTLTTTAGSYTEANGGITQPGINYKLVVTLKKQRIEVAASIAPWTDVYAAGEGEIKFNNDITDKGSIADDLKTDGFDVYKNSTQSFTTKSTTVKWETGKWTYDPVIYWAGQQDKAYFRALSPAGTTTSISQGTDVLWGYACDIAGATPTVEERAKIGTTDEVQITPRTGNVPLHFEHAMSKITVNLKTSDDVAKKVALDGATISISNLATDGTLNLVNGVIAKNTPLTEDAIPATAPISNYPVIPQTIDEASVLKITLADGTTYSLKLNSCEAPGGGAISNWERGMHYIYTIHLEKEAITFRALVKNWEEATGSGNATLDWD